jgi:hypothetical protein
MSAKDYFTPVDKKTQVELFLTFQGGVVQFNKVQAT